MKKKNVLVLQAGGPTAVINQTLKGIYDCFVKNRNYFGSLLGAHHALDGLLNEKLYVLSDMDPQKLDYCFELTGAALGSARLKPKEGDMQRIFEVFDAHNVGYVLYIGGNDTSYATQLIRAHANKISSEIQILHLPKTIDNDLFETDFCPGYPSSAQIVSSVVAGDDLDNRSFKDSVKVNVVMGRHTGWLAAASALSQCYFRTNSGSEERVGPHLIYFPETGLDLTRMLGDVDNSLKLHGRATITVAEGIADQLMQTNVVEEVDEFGNPLLADLGQLGEFLVKHLKKNLVSQKTSIKLRIRGDTLGYLQRSMLGVTSTIDKKLAHAIGVRSIEFLMEGVTDRMVKIQRREQSEFSIETCGLELVAGKTRFLPREMINDAGNYVSPLFYEYVQPLVDAIPHIEFLERRFVREQLPNYQRTDTRSVK